RGLVRLDHIHQVADILGDLRLGVKRESDDVPGMDHDPGVVPFLDDVSVLFDVILSFAFGLEVLGIDALHADKNLGAAGLGRKPHEILRFTGEIYLHHEVDLDAFLPELDDLLKGLAPELFTGKVIVGKEVEGDPVLAIVHAQQLGDAFGAALAHFTALDVDDGAKGAGKRTAPGRVRGAEGGFGEVAHGLGTDPGER